MIWETIRALDKQLAKSAQQKKWQDVKRLAYLRGALHEIFLKGRG